jgi:cobalt transporter subunit CbtB
MQTWPLGNREGRVLPPEPQVRRPAASTEGPALTLIFEHTEGVTLMTTDRISTSLSFSQRVAAGISAMVFGGFLVFGVGLAHADKLHNAAHDTRHSIGFPCH